MLETLIGILFLLAPWIIVVLLLSIRQINEYERGVRFTLGRYSGIMTPGWRLVVPVIQSYQKVDIRVRVADVPDQDAITKDNVSVNVNAVIYYQVQDAQAVIIRVENFTYAVSQLAQTTMRDVVGEVALDELLSQRDVISARIREIVDKATEEWGVKVASVDLKHIELPTDMVRTIAKQAEAEREKRADIIKAEGELAAAENMAKAAAILAAQPGALHLRTLQSINDISSDQSNTVVFSLPMEVLKAIDGFAKK